MAISFVTLSRTTYIFSFLHTSLSLCICINLFISLYLFIYLYLSFSPLSHKSTLYFPLLSLSLSLSSLSFFLPFLSLSLSLSLPTKFWYIILEPPWFTGTLGYKLLLYEYLWSMLCPLSPVCRLCKFLNILEFLADST